VTYPTPPGDNVPLYDGLDSSWNDIVGAFPEDKRGELAPILKSRIEEVQKQYEPLKQWEDLAKSGITPEHASTALSIYSMVENNPKQIYEELGKYLGISTAQAEKVAEAVQEDDSNDPRIQELQHKIDTIGQVLLAERNQTMAQKQQAEADAALERELVALNKKYPDVNEEEVVMRALQKNISLEEAYQDYTRFVSEVRKRPMTPMVMGAGGAIPKPNVDVRKLDSRATKDLVAQMITHANNERNA
jgi:hypothetical protein